MRNKRHVTATLLTTLSKVPPSHPPLPNPLETIKDDHAAKNVLLTLHVLYPNELLPALDLLDRSLVTRLHLATQDQDPPPQTVKTGTYVVKSTQVPKRQHAFGQRGSRHGHRTSIASRLQDETDYASLYDDGGTTSTSRDGPEDEKTYVVSIAGWFCTCPAFTFSLFPASGAEPAITEAYDQTGDSGDSGSHGCTIGDGEVRVGGLLRGEDVPVCKHLLACVLVEACPFLGGCVVDREALLEEIVGWGAGFGG